MINVIVNESGQCDHKVPPPIITPWQLLCCYYWYSDIYTTYMASKPTVATTSHFSLMEAALTFFEKMASQDNSTDGGTSHSDDQIQISDTAS